MNNPINDLFIRLKNAYMARLNSVSMPYSRFKEQILKKLLDMGYVAEVSIQNNGAKKEIVCKLVYKNSEPSITGLTMFSTPGRRWYIAKSDVKAVKNGYGISIISTSKGLLTNKEAKKAGLGGELLCEIW